jgi:hypothetical protein
MFPSTLQHLAPAVLKKLSTKTNSKSSAENNEDI